MDFFETIDLFHIIFGYLYLIPLILSAKYYYQLRISDYFLLTLYFLYWGLWGTLGQLDLRPLLPESVEFAINNIDALPLYIIALRARQKRPLWSYIGGIIPVILAIIVAFDTNYAIGIGIFPLAYWNTWFARIYYHGFVGVVFWTSETVENNNRVTWSKNLWVIHSIGWVFAMLLFIIDSGILQHPQDGTGDIMLVYLILIPITISAFVILILHLVYPEAVLITYEQIHRARKLYSVVELKLSGNAVKDFGISTINNYLNSIPKLLRE